MSPPSGSPYFLTTRWSVVLSAREDMEGSACRALEDLCRQYWYPLYAYARRAGQSSHDAEDITQEFFARLLEKDWLQAVSPEKGKFRNFLLVALKRFMANEWHRSMAKKRGGDAHHLPLDTADAEQRYASEPVAAFAADEIYERRWAMMLLEQALEQLGGEYRQLAKEKEFECLKRWLSAERGKIPYGDLAEELSSSEGAVRVAVHRLRKRFREVFREAIAQTVDGGTSVEDELRHFATVLSHS